MKAYTLIAASLLAVPVVALQAAQQPAQPVTQQQTGHILSAETHKSHHTTTVYNSTTGQYSHGGGTSVWNDPLQLYQLI